MKINSMYFACNGLYNGFRDVENDLFCYFSDWLVVGCNARPNHKWSFILGCIMKP